MTVPDLWAEELTVPKRLLAMARLSCGHRAISGLTCTR